MKFLTTIKILLIIILALMTFGCSSNLTQGFMITSPSQNETTPSDIPMFFSSFTYQPAGTLNQKTISMLGCIGCEEDGSTPAITLTSDVSKVIRSETIEAMKASNIYPSNNSQCSINGNVHLAGWNNITGDSYIDITFQFLDQDKNTFCERRLTGKYDAWFFEAHQINRLFKQAINNAAYKLMADPQLLSKIRQYCTLEV